MALQIIYLSTLFAFIFMLMTLRLAKKPKKSDSIPKLPPGPSKLPLIGSIHHLAGSIPHHQLRNLARKYGPLMHLKLGELPTIVISSPDYAKEVMKTHDIIFSSRPQIQTSKIMSYDSTSIAFSPYGEYWRQLRKICTMELLSPKRVQSFRPIREEEVSKLVKWIAPQEGSLINLTQAVMALIYTVISRAAFGMKCRDTEEFISVVKETVKISGGFDIGDLFPSAKWLQFVSTQRRKLEKLLQRSDRIMENIINDHKDAKSRVKEGQGEIEEDLVDVLLKFEDSSKEDFHLTNNNIKAILLDVFGAGGETSAITIDWAMAEMMKNPSAMKKAQAEVREIFNKKGMANENCINDLKYLKSVIKETLRLHPPAPLLLPRECGQACDINGYHITFKTKVIINAWAIARDPKYWNEPERFNPERFIDSSVDYKGNNFEYIPFGAGRRICPGMTFAAKNVELVLAFLLYHFDWKFPHGMKNEELDMTESFGVTVRRKDDLCLIPTAYCGLPVED